MLIVVRRADEASEQRMRSVGSGFEFGMKLHADVERVILDLHRLYQSAVGGNARGHQSARSQRVSVFVIEFVAVAVPFGYLFRLVTFVQLSPLLYLAGIAAES